MREKLNFDKGWMFHRGDIEYEYPSYKGFSYISAKTERVHIGPASRYYIPDPDSYELDRLQMAETWKQVNLPHDYIIEGVPQEQYNNALGFFKYDNAWYVKRFRTQPGDETKRLTLLFEGVATHATVYLNGCILKHNFCGYTSFQVDITDVVSFTEENHLAVYVDTSSHEGWWYEGGGIYRHVFLMKTERLAVDLWGVHVRPRHEADGRWTLDAAVTVRNDFWEEKHARVVCDILDAAGAVTATVTAWGTFADCEGKELVTNSTCISAPRLWSPDDPYQYTCRTRVYDGDVLCDETSVKFGFRYFRIDPDRGLFINDKHYKIQGLCGHADCGLMGKAVPDNIHRYKIRLMKEMGANGYRTSHYPQAEALMDALDENGFIVMDETRWFESSEEGMEQLTMLMKRDRNRPSVFFWSVGNEEPHHVSEQGRRICKRLMSLAHKLDDSRVIMTAVTYTPDKATVYDELEAIGINYNWNTYEYIHKKYPEKGVFASECCATGTTRGWYFEDDPGKAYISAYDHDVNEGFRGREFTWKFLGLNDWLLGGYQWIAFEHRGEAVWPRVCSQSGAIDLFMQKKDAFYQNQSHWTTEPMVHLLPHWNFAGLEGEPIQVWAYTNTSRVELFLNGESLGVREMEKFGHAEWTVPYTPGRLEALAYDGDAVAAVDVKITSGAPYALKLVNDTPDAQANGEDFAIVTCMVLDAEGNEVPDAAPLVSFHTAGDCAVYSTGSDVAEHDTIFRSERKMRAGRIGVAVKLGTNPDGMKLYAMADGLKTAKIEL